MKFFKKLWHRRYHSSHRRGVHAGVDNLRSTLGSPRGWSTTALRSTTPIPIAADCPQPTHTLTRMARCGDSGLSPISTVPITAACISSKFLPRRSRLGTRPFTVGRTGLRRSMSPRSISFQVEPESSTVVHRQPLPSLMRIGETPGETPTNRWLDLVVVWIEGTLWTWRRQRLVSPI